MSKSPTTLRAWRVGLIWGMVAGLCTAGSGYSHQHKVVVDPVQCSRLTQAQQNWLSPTWQPYLEYARICSIRNSKQEAVVLLVSVHADLYYGAQPGQSVHQVKMPDPLLFLPSGEVLGYLPYNFPDDPPAELRVTFARWEQGFPERIDLYLTDPRAGGNRSLPSLVWDSGQKKFLSQEEEHHE